MMSPVQMVLVGWAIMAAIMLALWAHAYVRKDASSVDLGWAAGLGILASFFALAADGWPTRKWIVAGLVGIWSFRLAVHLLMDRILGKPEDGRYQEIRCNWAGREHTFFFWFFQAQGLLDVILAVSFLPSLLNPEPRLGLREFAAVAVWLIAILGESIADRQLAGFRRDPNNRGKTCRIGLWRYSRHPNYFFEWLHWWTYVVLGLGLPFGWLSLIGPALMLFLILKVTGIPPTEARALVSRGEDYRQYQRTTSAFVPWFPRKEVVE